MIRKEQTLTISKAAVIGYPISHSLSPKIHNYLLERHNIAGEYEAIEVQKSDLESKIKSLAKEVVGFNATIPHKEEIFKICDFKSRTAILTGAVNTLTFTPDGKLFGHNSDAEGFINNLRNSQKDFDLKDKIAFVIGAGGASRAVVYSLIKSQVKKIYITNRSEKRAIDLIENFKNFSKEKECQLDFLDLKNFEEKLNECDLLVNSTSLGMLGQDKLVINLNRLNKGAVVYDIVYNPLMTDLLIDAKNRGNKIVTGVGMLIFQALVGFELWFKQKPDDKFVKELFSQTFLN